LRILTVVRVILPFLLALALGCAPKHPGAAPAQSGDDDVETQTIVEKTPNGTRTTTITRTKHVVEAPPPPPRPADPWPADPLVKFNVDLVNSCRAKVGAPPLLYDERISAFALDGSKQLASDHTAHAHFAANIATQPPGFGSRSAENQGDPNGVPPLADTHVASGKKQIQTLVKIMWDEGPGGGHYDNIVNTKYRRLGVGLYYVGESLYLTNDFSD
jgi:uncharacterized protein YkwD